MKPFLPVLVFQKIGTAPKNSSLKSQWTSFRRMENILAFLTKRHYTFITPEDLHSKLPAKPILLAFMGGYQSVYTEVFPLLKKYNAKAIVFVATDTLGTYNSWQDPYQEPWQNILTAQQLKEMYKSKYVQVGTLGLTGKDLLPHETPAREELLESVHRLATLCQINVCSVGFWPGLKDKNLARTREICAGLNLPVITSLTGKNPPDEKQFFRVLYPGLLTQFWLWKN